MSEGPLTREEADRSFRAIRRYLVLSGAWFALVAVLLIVIDMPSAMVYAIVIALIYFVFVPILLFLFRRGFDQRVRETEEGLIRGETPAP